MTAASRAPLATVVITTHNRDELAQRALQSALAQTLGEVEVVVVDDGSQPAFVPAVDDHRVRVIRRDQAGGVSAARNLGLGAARGAWITFLDDDDVILSNMLERSISAAESSSLPRPVAVNSAVAILDVDGAVAQTLVPPPALRRGEDYVLERKGPAGRAANSLVVPTEVMRAIGGFDEQLESFQHDDLGLRLNAVASIQGVDDALYRMTTHRDARVSARWTAIPADMERTLAKHPAAFARHPEAHARFMGALGFYQLKAGRWRDAVRWTARSVRRNPADRRNWFYLGAALAGPRVLAAFQRLRPPAANVSTGELMKRRARKYGRRLANYPRAVVAVPLARSTNEVIRRRVSPRADRSRSVLVLCVYRAANAATVRALLEAPLANGWDVRLWALDRTAPALADLTIGEGGGPKFPLLNGLIAGYELDSFDWVVVVDDDFAFDSGSLEDLLCVAEVAGLDLLQPAHTELSYRELEFGVRRPLSIARSTTFVEIGPMFAIRRPWVSSVIPFPVDHAMGWGLELEWFDLVNRGARLGIVDSVAIRHLAPVGAGYAKDEQRARLHTLLHARGLNSLHDIQHTTGVWRPWQPVPPWARVSDPA